MGEDDFGLWEREFDNDDAAGGRAIVVVACVTALGCAAMIVMGDVALGVSGLILSLVIFVLWRMGL